MGLCLDFNFRKKETSYRYKKIMKAKKNSRNVSVLKKLKKDFWMNF